MRNRGTGQWWVALVGCWEHFKPFMQCCTRALSRPTTHMCQQLAAHSIFEPPVCQIVDSFVSLFNGTGLGTGLALHSDSSLLLHHASPGARLLPRLCPTHVPHSLLCQQRPTENARRGCSELHYQGPLELMLHATHGVCPQLSHCRRKPAAPLLPAGAWSPWSDAKAMGNMLTSRYVVWFSDHLTCGSPPCLHASRGPMDCLRACCQPRGVVPSTSAAGPAPLACVRLRASTHPGCPATLPVPHCLLQLPQHPAAGPAHRHLGKAGRQGRAHGLLYGGCVYSGTYVCSASWPCAVERRVPCTCVPGWLGRARSGSSPSWVCSQQNV